MANAQDFTKIMQDMMASFPTDGKTLQDAFKSQAVLGEKMARVALEAAEKSTDITSTWTKSTIRRIGDLAASKEEPSDYAKSMSDFASAAAEMAAENMAAFAEIAKKVQMETVELMLAAGKQAQADATAGVKRATDEMSVVAKKSASVAAR